MPRNTWIVPSGTQITPAVIAQAQAAGCHEITSGIPPYLADKVGAESLPVAYVEPPPPPPPPPTTAQTSRTALQTNYAAAAQDPTAWNQMTVADQANVLRHLTVITLAQ